MAFDTVSEFAIEQRESVWVAGYTAMASPCEIHVCCTTKSEAERLASLALSETRRIEQKYSRYRNDNLLHEINHSNGRPVRLDEETRQLAQFADQCYKLSEGLFDITSGVLRKAWTFDGSEARPDSRLISRLSAVVGWDKVSFNGEALSLLPGMEIDLGGIGKEYAVDKVAQLLFSQSGVDLMVNFGGDIRTLVAEKSTRSWVIGIEDPQLMSSPLGHLELAGGAVATSGDARRFCFYQGRRLGHILNPMTGWPVADAPRSVTVVADRCVEAGFLATLSILHGPEAEDFLKAQGVVFHCSW